MTLALPKKKRVTNRAYVKWIKTLPCLVLNSSVSATPCILPIDPHHVTPRSLGGSDYTCVPLCRRHHDEANNRAEFEAKYPVVLDYEIVRLNRQYAALNRKPKPIRKPVEKHYHLVKQCAHCGGDHQFPWNKDFTCPMRRVG